MVRLTTIHHNIVFVAIVYGLSLIELRAGNAENEPAQGSPTAARTQLNVDLAIKVVRSRDALIEKCMQCLRGRRMGDCTDDDAAYAAEVMGMLGANDRECIKELCLHITLRSKIASSPDALDGFGAAKALVAIGNKHVVNLLLERLHADKLNENEVRIIAHIFSRIDTRDVIIGRFTTAVKSAESQHPETAAIFVKNIGQIQRLFETDGFPISRQSWPAVNSNR